ncbi:MAG: hypothetical protein JRG80_12295 [Deltaproteobacteria bacterium]|nr:hypothetical protein [Deltaproteobacteria bacterium]
MAGRDLKLIVTEPRDFTNGVRRVQFVRRLRARLLLGWLAGCVPTCMALYIFLGEAVAGWALAVYVAVTVGVVIWEAILVCPRCETRLEGFAGLIGVDRESKQACRYCSLALAE